MPLNESSGPSSNLTEKEQREAMRAVYGLAGKGNSMSPDRSNDLSFEERQKMRRHLDALDQQEARPQVFDLNKPPVAPYIYQEYPRLMYFPGGSTKLAHNRDEHSMMLETGWKEKPVPPEQHEGDLSEQEQAEINMIDQRLKGKKK